MFTKQELRLIDHSLSFYTKDYLSKINPKFKEYDQAKIEADVILSSIREKINAAQEASSPELFHKLRCLARDALNIKQKELSC